MVIGGRRNLNFPVDLFVASEICENVRSCWKMKQTWVIHGQFFTVHIFTRSFIHSFIHSQELICLAYFYIFQSHTQSHTHTHAVQSGKVWIWIYLNIQYIGELSLSKRWQLITIGIGTHRSPPSHNSLCTIHPKA